MNRRINRFNRGYSARIFFNVRRPDDFRQIPAITAFLQWLSQRDDLIPVDEALPERDFLQAGDLHSLPGFEGLHEARRFDQRIYGAGIEPGKASPHPLDVESLGREIPHL